jgi:phenylalanine-4-hydroxylase
MKVKNLKKAVRQKNTKLIAAAPFLLEACQSILTTLEELELDDIGALQDVREAIQRATC